MQNLGQAIVMGKIDIDTNFFFTPPGIVLQIACIFILILIINNLYITFKLKQTLVILSVLQAKITRSEGSDQVVLNYFKTARAKENSVSSNTIISVLKLESTVAFITCFITFAILLLVVLFLIRKIFLYCKRKLRPVNTKLFLFFQSPTSSSLIFLMDFLCLKEDLDFSITDQIHNIRVENILQPLLLFDWNLKFSSKISGEKYPLPHVLHLTWFQAGQLRKLLRSAFTVQLLYKSHNRLFSFNLSTDCNECTPVRPIGVLSKTTNSTVINKLYPTL